MDNLTPAFNCSKIVQDMAFARMLEPTIAEKGQKRYCIGGITVCAFAMARLLGIGRGSRWGRLQKGVYDQRFGPRGLGDPRGSSRQAYSMIYGHLWRRSLATR